MKRRNFIKDNVVGASTIGFLSYLIIAIALVVSFNIVGYAKQACAAPGGHPIKIASILPMTGPAAAYGARAWRGCQIAEDYINAHGGIKGRKLEMVLLDNGGARSQSCSMTRKAATDPDIIATIGQMRTVCAIAASPVCEELGIVLISTASMGLWPTEYNAWTFRNTLPVSKLTPPLIRQSHDALSYKTAAIIYAFDDDFAVHEFNVAKKTFEEVGVKVVDITSYRTGDIDFKAQTTKITHKSPDVLWLAGLIDELGPIMAQLREAGYEGQFMGGAGLGNPKYYKLSGGAGEGTLCAISFDKTSGKKPVKKILEAYKARFGTKEEVMDRMAWAWDAIFSLKEVIEKTEEPITREKVREGLSNLKGFESSTGIYSYEGSGDCTRETVVLVRMHQGKYEIWRP